MVLRNKPKLTSDAYPTKFPNHPRYLSIKLPPKRSDPNVRAAASKLLEEAAKSHKEEVLKAKDIVIDYLEFKDKFNSSRYLNKYSVSLFCDKNANYFLKHNFDSWIPEIVYSIRVQDNLDCDVFKNCILGDKYIVDILGKGKKCDKWSKLDALFSYVSSLTNLAGNDDNLIDPKLTLAADLLYKCTTIIDYDSTKLNKIVFLEEQIKLLLSCRIKYSSHTLIWACTLYYAYPGGYIHLRKGGDIEGFSCNSSTESATTIQVFMLSSITSSNKDVVSLFPVKNLKNEYLFDLTKQVL